MPRKRRVLQLLDTLLCVDCRGGGVGGAVIGGCFVEACVFVGPFGRVSADSPTPSARHSGVTQILIVFSANYVSLLVSTSPMWAICRIRRSRCANYEHGVISQFAIGFG